MADDNVPPWQGHLTIEDVAHETNRSAGTIRNIIKKLKIGKSVFPGDNRERIAPGDVQRIKVFLKAPSSSRASNP